MSKSYRYKVVIDENIPYIKGILEPYLDTIYIKGSLIKNEDIIDADAMIIRTRTKCNASLLSGTRIKLIATATIGTDHIDLEYCKENNIAVASAPGCNSNGVMEYVFTALQTLENKLGLCLKNKTLGVIGAGNVGSKVISTGKELKFRILANDPYICKNYLVDLDELLSESDIITVHIPLWEQNRDFINGQFIKKMKPGTIFINASRGEVVNEEDLLSYRHKFGAIVLDVWKNEPNINLKLLNAVDIATPHIAGYTIEGKRNGTAMVIEALANFFKIPDLLKDIYKFNLSTQIKKYIPNQYDIMADDRALRANPANFELLRNNYNFR